MDSTNNVQQDQAQKKRRRPPLACEQCRSRKIRCNREAPCGPCVKSKMPNCTYAPSHQPRSRARKPAAPAERLESGTGTEPGALPGAGVSRPVSEVGTGDDRPDDFIKNVPFPVANAGSASSPPSSRAGSASQSSTVEALHARVRQLEKRLGRVDIAHDEAPGEILSHYEETTAQTVGAVSKTRYYGQSHWLSGVELFPNQIEMFTKAARQKDELCELLVNCKRLGRRIKENRFEPLSSLSIGKQVPPRALAEELVERYLQTFEGVLRILHVPTFRAECERYWQSPEAASEAFVVQLQLCMALGAVTHDDTHSLRATAVRWVHEAQLWLILPPEKARMTIAGLQIRCLLCLARATASVSHDLIWSFAGSLVRTAMAMGLHRDPKYLTQMTTYRAEMRRRLWATILELNLQSAYDAGGSALLSGMDYDTLPPANLDDEQLTDEPDPRSGAGPSKDDGRGTPLTGASVQVELVKSLPLRTALLQHTNESRASSSYSETLRLNSELTRACRSLSRSLASWARAGGVVRAFHVSMAEMLVYRGFHALHQPVITRSFLDPKYYFSRKMCIESSLKIMDISGLSRQKNAQYTGAGAGAGAGISNGDGIATGSGPSLDPADDPDTRRLAVNAAGLFRHIRIQALVAAVLELIYQRGDEATGLGYLSARDNSDLRASLEAAAEWLHARVRSGETNIKANCFLASCLGHADALEMGLGPADMEQLMNQRTTEAARRCWTMLRDVAEREGVPLHPETEPEALGPGPELEMPMDWLGSLAWDEFPQDAMWSGFTQGAGDVMPPMMPM